MPPPQRRPPRSASRRKRERRRDQAIRHAGPGRRRPSWLWSGIGAVVVVAALIALIVLLRGSPSTPGVAASHPSPTPAPSPTATLLAPVTSGATGAVVDGIQCQTGEQLVSHIHAHLSIFVNGSARTVPEGIGIPTPRSVQTDAGPFVEGGTCFYWLHTHTDDGILHIESPTQKSYTLGEFFDIWGQTLSTTQVGPATGTVNIYVNSQLFSGDPRTIPLTAHAVIQIDVGTPVPPQPYSFPPGL